MMFFEHKWKFLFSATDQVHRDTPQSPSISNIKGYVLFIIHVGYRYDLMRLLNIYCIVSFGAR